jgi:hypothetical protein
MVLFTTWRNASGEKRASGGRCNRVCDRPGAGSRRALF